jgi:hypothetical protein
MGFFISHHGKQTALTHEATTKQTKKIENEKKFGGALVRWIEAFNFWG